MYARDLQNALINQNKELLDALARSYIADMVGMVKDIFVDEITTVDKAVDYPKPDGNYLKERAIEFAQDTLADFTTALVQAIENQQVNFKTKIVPTLDTSLSFGPNPED